MLLFKIPNFVQTCPLDVLLAPGVCKVPAFVTLRQFGGSTTFHHSLTAQQARDMAAALLQCADAADAREFDEALAGIDDAELADLAADLELQAEAA